jgi:hypothetical protein
MKWLDEHLETFVRPRLGYIPNLSGPVTYTGMEQFPDGNIKALFEIWQQAKKRANGKPILLPGRDVFLVEIMARLEDFPDTVFKPEYSSQVSKSGLVKEDYSKHYCLDTGYSGSVPKALGCKDFNLVSYRAGTNVKLHRLFPDDDKHSHLASPMECVAKYWDPGNVVNKQIVQKITTSDELFATAAKLTRHIVKAVVRLGLKP